MAVRRRNGRYVQTDAAEVRIGLTVEQRQGRRLAAALIAGAICAVAQPTYLVAIYRHADRRMLAAMRAAERRWLMSDSTAGDFAFVRCCEALRVEPDALRAGFRQRGWLDGTPMTKGDVRRLMSWVRAEEGATRDAADPEPARAA